MPDDALVAALQGGMMGQQSWLDQADAPLEYHRAARDIGVAPTASGKILFRYQDIVDVCRHKDIVMWDPVDTTYVTMGADHPLGPHSRDGADHTRFRKLLDPHFSPRKMAARRDQVVALTNQLIDRFIEEGQVEAHDAFAVPLPSRIFLDLMGLDPDDAPMWIAFKDGILRPQSPETDLDGGNRLRAYLAPLLDERLAAPGRRNGLIDELLHAEQEGDRLSRDEVIDVIQLLVIAGLDTVTSSLSDFLAWLAQHPTERAELAADLALIPMAVEELLRYESPVPAGTRWPTKPIEVNGMALEAGELLHLIWGSANLDPAAFEDPATVDWHRTDNKHLAFAAGPHRCLGSHLARLELATALEEWLRRIPDFWITPGEEPRYAGFGVRSVPYLPLSWG